MIKSKVLLPLQELLSAWLGRQASCMSLVAWVSMVSDEFLFQVLCILINLFAKPVRRPSQSQCEYARRLLPI